MTKTGTSVAKAKNLPAAQDTMPKTGRGNPPKHTQFKKGVSGNTNGRPRGLKNVSTHIMAAARDRVTATIDGKPRRITKLQATAMQPATKAASGDRASLAKFLDWVDKFGTRAAAAKPVEFPFSKASLALARGLARNRRAHGALYFCRWANEMAPWNGAPIISTRFIKPRSVKMSFADRAVA